MKRVYIAGSYSADNVLDVLDNMRRGMRAGVEVLLAGYAPFVPWFDFHFQLMLQEGEKLTVEQYYEYSLAWLAVSDAVLVLPNSELSHGTQKEIGMATRLGIRVYRSLEELTTWVDEEVDRP
jgi:nucleoside 2-deoxyribosyltransferase